SGPIAGSKHKRAADHAAQNGPVTKMQRHLVCAQQQKGHAEDQASCEQADPDGDERIEHGPWLQRARLEPPPTSLAIAAFPPTNAPAAHGEAFAGHASGPCVGRGRVLMARKKDSHPDNFGFLGRNDLIGQITHVAGFAMLDGDLGHCERTLVVGDHSAQEVDVGVARVVDAHGLVHLRAGLAIGASRWAVRGLASVACLGVARARVSRRRRRRDLAGLPRDHPEGEGRQGEKDGDDGNPSETLHDDVLERAGGATGAAGIALGRMGAVRSR
ncbi:hypothetical protein LTR94_028428, partial [Friedmanniomyces endolithicus]